MRSYDEVLECFGALQETDRTFTSYRSKGTYIWVYEYKALCYAFPVPRMDELKLLICVASALLQLTISFNVRQSLSDNDNIPEAATVGLFCVLHKNCVDGRWKNVYARRLARVEWIDRNELRFPTPSYA